MLTESSYKCAYSTSELATLYGLVGNPDTFTHIWSDRSFMAYYGYIRTIVMDDVTEGQQPTLTVTIQPTNTDPVTGDEEGPVFGDL